MYRKIIGILILFSFLFVKHATLFGAEANKPVFSVEQSTQDQQEENKEPKQAESFDEDLIVQEMSFTVHQLIAVEVEYPAFQGLGESYFSLPHPPPDCLS